MATFLLWSILDTYKKNIHIWVIDNVIVSFQKSQFAIMTDWQITKEDPE